MSIQDFRDRMDAEEAMRLAKSHGDSDSIVAFRDRVDASRVVSQYNETQKLLDKYRERYGYAPEGQLDIHDLVTQRSLLP